MLFYFFYLQRAPCNKLNQKSFLLFLILLIIKPSLSLANCWLPKPKQYKIFSSFSIIDKDTIKKRKVREEIYLNSQFLILELREMRSKLEAEILKSKGVITNNEKRRLGQIDKDLKELELISIEQKAYQDEKMSNLSIEYGIDEKHSFGVKIGYRLNKFIAYQKEKGSTSGKNIDVFLKYNFFTKNNLTLTLQPQVYVDSYGKLGNKVFQELHLMAGYSRETISKASRFSEVGIYGGSCISTRCHGENLWGVNFTEGVKLKNGMILYNFLQYYIRKIDNKIYSKSLYEQISVAKEIRFGRLKHNNFTISAGYFSDQSLVDRSFKSTGPIFSLWFNI